MDKKLPKDWKLVKLSDIGKIISGGTPSTAISEYWKGNINWIAPSDLTGYKNIKIKSGKKSITELGLKKSSAKLMPKGSVLFSSRAPIGYTVIADDELCTNQGFKSIIPHDFVNNLYIYYFLKASKQEAEKVASGTTFKEISLRSFSELSFPLPPLETQQVIVSKIEELFSELDKGIEDLKTAQQQLKTYRQSVLKWAFEGKKKLPIGDLFDFVGGGTPSKQNPDYWVGDIPWASVKDIKGEYLNDTIDRISDEGLKNSSANIADKGEVILITRISPGKAIITNIKTAINQDLKVVRPKFETTSKFIFYVFQAIERECIKKSNGTTVLGINLTSLKEIEVPNLNVKEQDQIVQEIESRLSVADKMEESIAHSLLQAESLRQSILKKAFSGELFK